MLMTASFKKLLALFLVCLAIAGCGDQQKINELQTQLDSCKAQADTNYNAWFNKKQALDDCLTANDNLYNFVENKGTVLDKTAKMFAIYPWQTLVVGSILLVALLIVGVICFSFFLEWRDNEKHKEAKRTIKTAKEARQAILEASDRLSHIQDQQNALEAQKTTLLSELEELKQYQNIDELKEKAKIITEAKAEASKIFEENTSKINAQVAQLQAELDQERAELNKEWETLSQKEQELNQKERELEEDRQAMING
jgi:outer membrane murein-binding lipoprotein Lpp